MNMNDYADMRRDARQEAGEELRAAELRLERHLDMLQSNDGMIDQLRRNTDFAQTLMELVAWAIEHGDTDSPSRQREIFRMANVLHRQARRGV